MTWRVPWGRTGRESHHLRFQVPQRADVEAVSLSYCLYCSLMISDMPAKFATIILSHSWMNSCSGGKAAAPLGRLPLTGPYGQCSCPHSWSWTGLPFLNIAMLSCALEAARALFEAFRFVFGEWFGANVEGLGRRVSKSAKNGRRFRVRSEGAACR